jgi:type IV pilus assembly protein PilW
MNRQGFTLIELMLAMTISMVLMGAVFMIYNNQSRSYVAQEQAAAMEQNLRAGLYVMSREIRLAGYDENPRDDKDSDGIDNDCDGSTDEGDENFGIRLAQENRIQITMDLTPSDGDTCDAGETVSYFLYTNGDGVQCLGRALGGGAPQPVAQFIDALNLVYRDGDGNQLNDDGLGNVTANIADIRSIQMTLVARSRKEEPTIINNADYRNLMGDVIFQAPGDHFRRQVQGVEIRSRNLGIRQRIEAIEAGG